MNEKRLTVLNPYTLFIDDVNVADLGCLVESYTVGPAAVNSAIFQGRNRTTFRQLAYTIGRRDITVSLFYAAKTQRELAEQKSQVDARLLGTPDLHLPDGFHYFAVLKSAGDLKILGIEGNRVIGLASYKLEGIRHDSLQTVTGNTIKASGTMPQMDAIFSCATTAARSALQVGPVTFRNVPAGAAVVADGINGRLTVNGVAAAANATFTRLPFVVPGQQTITCPETLTVQYYPCWV